MTALRHYIVTVEVTVFDPDEVKTEALTRALQIGHTAADWAKLREDTSSDLAILFETGISLDGLEIQKITADLAPL